MRALATGLVVATSVLVAVAPRHPRHHRAAHEPGDRPPARGRLLGRIGAPVARRSGLPTDPRTAQRLGLATVAAVVLLPLAPPLGVAILAATWMGLRLGRKRSARGVRRAVHQALPDAVDLLLLGLGAGLSLPLIHAEVAPRLPGPLGAALRRADEEAATGRPRADAIVAALAPFGDRAAGLAQVLADHLRYGVPLGPALERVSFEVRLDRRRQAELDARQVPVRLLGPLVTCSLPAFALLTVVPLLVVSLQGLPS